MEKVYVNVTETITDHKTGKISQNKYVHQVSCSTLSVSDSQGNVMPIYKIP